MPDEGEADEHRCHESSTATPWSDVAASTASDSGGIATSVRLWALPMNARPNPRRAGSIRCGTSESAAGRVRRDADPLEDAGDDERPRRPARLDAGSMRMAQPMR